jgi:hypothetical protein
VAAKGHDLGFKYLGFHGLCKSGNVTAKIAKSAEIKCLLFEFFEFFVVKIWKVSVFMG